MKASGENKSSHQGFIPKLIHFTVNPSVLIIFMTAIVYLQGRAYRWGYLQELGMTDQRLHENLHDYLTYAYHGWVDLIIFILNAMKPSNMISMASQHPVIAVTIYTLLMAALAKLLIPQEIKLLAYRLGFTSLLSKKESSLANMISRIFLTAALPAYLLFLPPLFIAFVLGAPVEPFAYFGQEKAKFMLLHPKYEVTIKSPSTEISNTLKAIECTTDHCLAINKNKISLIKSDRIENLSTTKKLNLLPENTDQYRSGGERE